MTDMNRLIWLFFLSLTTTATLAVKDPHSFANPESVTVTDMTLKLSVDFKKKSLQGSNTLKYKVVDPSSEHLILDTRELDIEKVTYNEAGKDKKLKWHLSEAKGILGQALHIKLPPKPAAITVHYQSRPSASGLQWLDKEQTAGGKHPFLFSQSQAIHARSWIPLQDTPSVRTPYQATIEAPAELRVVMSAKNQAMKSEDGVYHFHMPQPIPSYLIAIAVGDLSYQKISPRVAIYSEWTYLEKAAYEFALTEQMIEAAETLYGEYRWGDFDLLILPPSFPFGGMENPRLSFITPTIIAGDRSLDSLIAHELAHSWSGNLVTNASWRDLWLNEGFTSYFEARITEAVHGTSRMKMEAALNLQGLKAEMKTLAPEMQALEMPADMKDPDDVFSAVAYDKGRFFLEWLEVSVGRPTFDAFLKQYFSDFAFKSIDTAKFLKYLDQHLIQPSQGKVTMDQVKAWVYQAGLPDGLPVPTTNKFKAIDQKLASMPFTADGLKAMPTAEWTTQEWLHFLHALPNKLSHKQMQLLDDTWQFSEKENAEIVHVWLLMAIRNDYQPAFGRLVKYLKSIGRMKLIVPLYEQLAATEKHRTLGKNIYQNAQSGYHNLARFKIDPLFPESPKERQQ